MKHAVLLILEQINEFRASLGLDADTEWACFGPDSDAGRLCCCLDADGVEDLAIMRAPVPGELVVFGLG